MCHIYKWIWHGDTVLVFKELILLVRRWDTFSGFCCTGLCRPGSVELQSKPFICRLWCSPGVTPNQPIGIPISLVTVIGSEMGHVTQSRPMRCEEILAVTPRKRSSLCLPESNPKEPTFFSGWWGVRLRSEITSDVLPLGPMNLELFHHVEPEKEGSKKVGRIGGGSPQVLSDIMGAIEPASSKAKTNSVAWAPEFPFLA